MKFGGTSVGDVPAFERVLHVVSSQIDRHPVVVVSAMTKVTDALLAAFETAKKGDANEAFDSLDPHFNRHAEVLESMVSADTRGAFARRNAICPRRARRPAYASFPPQPAALDA